MKRLFILRHAKSSWADPGMGDAKRPLNTRGNQQIADLDQWLSQQQHLPSAVICSPAVRTRQTHEGLPKSLATAEFEIEPTLYNGMIEDYLNCIYSQSADSIMLIGHNPTCDELARYLTSPSSPAFEKLMSLHFGTCALAIFNFDIEKWSEIREGNGSLEQFIRPKELATLQ